MIIEDLYLVTNFGEGRKKKRERSYFTDIGPFSVCSQRDCRRDENAKDTDSHPADYKELKSFRDIEKFII